MSQLEPHAPTRAVPGGIGEVFGAFLVLGLTSFGGPIAHVGYLREQFVRRRGWLDEARFAQLLAVCQFLPGPASSQMGFAIGLFRGGWRGALAAFVGFTLPSALLMFAAAMLATYVGSDVGASIVQGLKLVAVVVVAHGLMGMVRSLAPDARRLAIAIVSAALLLWSGQAWLQLLAIALGGLLGLGLCRGVQAPAGAVFPVRYGRAAAAVCLALFLLGLALAWWASGSATATPGSLGGAFYRAGALVFGGGHVVLPLLEHAVVDPGWVRAEDFLAGYGMAQAVPGPMFSLAAFLGALAPLGLPAVVGALVALLCLFLPGMLVLSAVLPVWSRLAQRAWAASAMAGINAAVVGLLGAAFYDPVLTTGVRGPGDLVIALAGFVLLARLRRGALWVVAWCVAASLAIAMI